MTRVRRTFRVFVSSTFGDMIAERYALQTRAFPRLAARCAAAGGQFVAVDLRWGVSEEAGAERRTMDICLDEVRRCQRTSLRPNFLILCGDRYGWRPLPPRAPAAEFDALCALLDPDDRAALAAGYRRDDNADPPEYRFLPRAEGGDETRLRRLLDAALADPRCPLVPAQRGRYEDGATHQEITAGLFAPLPASAAHVFAYCRSFVDLPERATPEAAVYTEYAPDGRRDDDAQTRLNGLQTELDTALNPGKHIHRYRARHIGWPNGDAVQMRGTPFGLGAEADEHLAALCARVESDLWSVIAPELEAAAGVTDVEEEIAHHWRVARERGDLVLGRHAELDRLRDYVRSGPSIPLLVVGAGGAGKTALLARVAVEYRLDPQVRVVARFLGTTPAVSDPTSFLRGLCEEVGAVTGHRHPPPVALDELIDDLPRRLADVPDGITLLLVVDALDQLSEASWLPRALPPRVRLIASAPTEAPTADFPVGPVVTIGPLATAVATGRLWRPRSPSVRSRCTPGWSSRRCGDGPRITRPRRCRWTSAD